MAAMGEEDMVGLLVEPFPGDFFPIFLKLFNLFFAWMLGNGIHVALHADGGFWHT